MFKLIEFLKNSFFLTNFASWVVSLIPPFVEHNLGKYTALRRAFFLTALEQLEGDYLEFGVFTGSSFIAATRFHKRMKALGKEETRFWGFDSFQGFGNVSAEEQHPFYLDSIFTVNAERVIRNIRKKAKGVQVEIVKGYFDHTLQESTATERGIKKARIVFIDCDLKVPAKLVLDWVRPVMQEGMILLMDDFYSFKGNSTKGLSGAFNTFCEENPELSFRKLYDYGCGGVVYILSSTEAGAQSRIAA